MKDLIVNPRALEQWRDVDPVNWARIVDGLLEIFENASRPLYGELLNAHLRSDWKRLAAVAHVLKSNCGNIGAEAAFMILDRLENHASVEDQAIPENEIDHLMRRFQPVFHNTCDWVQEYRRNGSLAAECRQAAALRR